MVIGVPKLTLVVLHIPEVILAGQLEILGALGCVTLNVCACATCIEKNPHKRAIKDRRNKPGCNLSFIQLLLLFVYLF